MVGYVRVRTVDDRGRVCIPRPWLRALEIQDGDNVSLKLDQSTRSVEVKKWKGAET